MNKVFSIESDLLGLVSFLVCGGNGCDQYGAGIWFLTEVRGQLKPKNIASYIITLAFDNLPSDILESYCKYAVGLCSLTKTTERFLRDRGFLYGEIPQVPRLVKLECKWRIKYVYELLNEIQTCYRFDVVKSTGGFRNLSTSPQA